MACAWSKGLLAASIHQLPRSRLLGNPVPRRFYGLPGHSPQEEVPPL